MKHILFIAIIPLCIIYCIFSFCLNPLWLLVYIIFTTIIYVSTSDMYKDVGSGFDDFWL
jgi:hypothetical protein